MKKIISPLLLILFISIISLSSCHKDGSSTPSKTFVLVAGAWQGAYAWQYVKPQLEKAGQKVIVVELPAHGDDNTPPYAVSMDVYRDKVISAINGVSGKVILVGHSMAGVVVSAVAEKIPAQLEKVVYIGAFLPANGQSLTDLAFTDAQSLLGPSLILSADSLTFDVKPADRINIFCQDGSADVQSLISSKFRVEPTIPFSNKVTLTDANFGSVDKYYIHTTQDHAIGLDLQNRMVTAAHITKTYSLNSGHCPFLSMPDLVTSTFLDISRK